MTNPFIPTTSGLQPNAGLLGTPGAIVATSTSSITIATGTLSFQVQPQCVFAPGMPIFIVDTANTANWMWGTVTSYSGTTLIVSISQTNGSGTIATWEISLSGAQGPTGTKGDTGATGAAGSNAGPVLGSAWGLRITNRAQATPNTKLDITALAALMVNSSGISVVKKAVSVTLDTTTGNSTSAANGMDGEAPLNNAWIYLYLINNGSGTTACLGTLTSPLSGAPTLPSGYTYSLYVGAMFVNGSGNLYQSIQSGRRAQFIINATTVPGSMPQVAQGTSGSVTTPTWTSVTILGTVYCPATAGVIRISATIATGGSGTFMAAPNNNYGADTSLLNPPPLLITGGGTGACAEFTLESSAIFYASSAADATMLTFGWEDYAVNA